MELLQSVVGIVARPGRGYKFSGTGFFVEGGFILTCAHVVDEAEKNRAGQVLFYIEGQAKRYTANVIFTSPTYEGQDLCVLQPIDLEESASVQWLKLIGSQRNNKYEFKTFGYPIETGAKGIIGVGSVYGWKKDEFERDVLQLSSKEVKKGFSGGPIIEAETGGVVGMTRDGFDFGLDKKLGEIGFAIPSEIIQKSFPQLKIHEGHKCTTNTGWFYGHRYGDLATFTGRAAELKMLDEWLANDTDNLYLMTAFGGFGKTALAWTWFNRVDRAQWPTAIWWSFYEKESGFESFLYETLKHLGVEVKESARQQVNDLLEAMRGTNILIVLDGFERLLRQYGRMDAALQSDDEDTDIDPSQRDCASPLTETFLRGLSGAGMKSKVLVTTRLCPRALESSDGKLLKGCREEPLAAFSPEDAVTYFHNEGIKATRAEVIEVCAAYGYHPLSLSLLVGLINEDHEQRGDIAAVKNLEIFEDVRARRHHVLERAYGSLAPERRDLLSKISCFRGSLEYAVLKKVFPSADLDKALLDLRKRGLLQQISPLFAGEGAGVRYDLHPIVRHYAYDHFTDEKRRKEAHVQLAMHFVDAMPVMNKNVKTLEDLAPVIELYHHLVRAGNLFEALKLFHDYIWQTLYYQLGGYQLQIELLRALFLDGEDKPPRLKIEGAQAFALNELANAYSMIGQPRHAVPLFEMQNVLQEKASNKGNLAIGLANLAYMAQLPIGALMEAEYNQRRSIDLCHEIADEFWEANVRREFGCILSYRGAWIDAQQELDKAISVQQKNKYIQAESGSHAHLALRFLLMARDEALFDTRKLNDESQISNNENRASAIVCAQRALELAEQRHKDIGHPNISDYLDAYWLLGAAYCASVVSMRSAKNARDYSTTELESLTLAEENLSKALDLCRQINMVDREADILLELARLRYASHKNGGTSQDDLKDAQEKASEALVITERSGYVLQGADVNLMLAELMLAEIREQRLESSKGKEQARKYAEEALRLATCDGPPYYYKVAYEEAERLIEKLTVVE